MKDTERRYGELGLPAHLHARVAEMIESHLLATGPTGARAAPGVVRWSTDSFQS